MAELEFEKPLRELERRIHNLRLSGGGSSGFDAEITRLQSKARQLQREIFSALSPWQKVQLSRHPDRPYTLDYVSRLCEDFVELHGDRTFSDDRAIVAGFAKFRGKSVLVVGHQKGRGTRENMLRNFGMPNPEGYRKSRRLMELADRFNKPIITFVDTSGAYPGIGAEERGQSEAIGQSLLVMAELGVPVVTVVIGEGGSGGALALAVANKVLVLEFATYSVISPEGCASILWKDGSQASRAASELKITAPDLLRLGVVDGVIDEPAGGAHRDHDEAARAVGDAVASALEELGELTPGQLREQRYRRFRALGHCVERT
ncbi:MAG: acetyl-CoA carboxylase carboxyltransferase subunit alpha [Polyangiales bacterium]